MFVIKLKRRAGSKISGDAYLGVAGTIAKNKASAKRYSATEVTSAIMGVALNPKLDNFEPIAEDE